MSKHDERTVAFNEMDGNRIRYDERSPAERKRDERIAALEAQTAHLTLKIRMQGASISGEAERLDKLYSRVSEEIARQATELGAEIAHQFAAARQHELAELTCRVAKLEQWQDEMDVLPDNHADEEVLAYLATAWPQEDGYEDPGPDSISPLG